MNPRMLLLLLPLALAACTPPDENPPGAENTATVPAAPAAEPAAPPAATTATTGGSAMLAGHRWKLDTATDAQGKRIDALFPGPKNVLTLSFDDGNLGVSGGCNRQGGSYELDAQNQLKVGALRATMMACDAPLMQADAAIGKLLSQPQQARVEVSAPPRLHLVSAGGENSTWIGEATAETRFGGPGERVFLEVAPQRVACNHPLIPNHQCLQVREVKFDDKGIRQQPPGEWQPLYEDIEGFEFREGTRTVLRLDKFKRDPVPADASSIVYVLDMVVESETVPAGK
ncbi:heat shock protein HslJ [Luteimonas cucumeris]|uniref:Heat shock protein HslJ n=1 Tax=Luteimonas cucumeris TaxID=985012 RepID=A0A562LDV4_9GAMM|nr:META and DUF4377 domain-containing protein [Luteimonas cucumeris]TWI05746.1 heat shock protein HslJ [Luteimonas cucumeris]